MRRNLLVVVSALAMFNCGRVIRDKGVYQAEVTFMGQASTGVAAQLEAFVVKSCTCTNGKFVTEECRKAADDSLVIKTRMPWHKAMMLFNADLGPAPSKEPPVVPAAESLCPGITPVTLAPTTLAVPVVAPAAPVAAPVAAPSTPTKK